MKLKSIQIFTFGEETIQSGNGVSLQNKAKGTKETHTKPT